MSGIRLLIGALLMGIILPVALFLLLGLQTISQLLTLGAATFLTWGVADLLSSILERPRLEHRSPQDALREDWERRSHEDPGAS